MNLQSVCVGVLTEDRDVTLRRARISGVLRSLCLWTETAVLERLPGPRVYSCWRRDVRLLRQSPPSWWLLPLVGVSNCQVTPEAGTRGSWICSTERKVSEQAFRIAMSWVARFYWDVPKMEVISSFSSSRFPRAGSCACGFQFLSNHGRPTFSSCQFIYGAYQGERIATAV